MKPLFRYMGGKTWLSERLSKHLLKAVSRNPELDSYCEPFSGGMGSFLNALETLKDTNIKTFYVNDINSAIINFYRIVYVGGEELQGFIGGYKVLAEEFNSRVPEELTDDKEKLSDLKDMFLEFRSTYNENNSYILLPLLQQLSFNGIYRENKKGQYNTPYGWRNKPLDVDKFIKTVEDMHKYLSQFNIVFSVGDYKNVMDKKDCLYYLDPPYFNTDGTKESDYSEGGFVRDEQKVLIGLLSGKKFLYSNHFCPIMFHMFSECVDMEDFERSNRISSGDRKEPKLEMLVFNY